MLRMETEQEWSKSRARGKSKSKCDDYITLSRTNNSRTASFPR